MQEMWLLAMERERQTGNEEGQEKDRQDALPAASEAGDFALGDVEALGAARVSAAADLEAVRSGWHGHLERTVQFQRSDMIPVEQDVVRATTDLHSDGLVGQLQRG